MSMKLKPAASRKVTLRGENWRLRPERFSRVAAKAAARPRRQRVNAKPTSRFLPAALRNVRGMIVRGMILIPLTDITLTNGWVHGCDARLKTVEALHEPQD